MATFLIFVKRSFSSSSNKARFGIGFDIDGVLLRGKKVIPRALEV